MNSITSVSSFNIKTHFLKMFLALLCRYNVKNANEIFKNIKIVNKGLNIVHDIFLEILML